MQRKDHRFPQEIYSDDLVTIDGIRFTPREIDVIACFVNARGASKIASLLSISPHTAQTHSRNIVAKLGCNSRENIIDFVERSGKLPLFRKYYTSLIIDVAFREVLKKISKLERRGNVVGAYVYWQDKSLKDALMAHLVDHLKYADIHAIIREKRKDESCESKKHSEELSFVFIEKQDHQEISFQGSGFITIDLLKEKNYYFAVFKVLRTLVSDNHFENVFKAFLKQYKGLEEFSNPSSSLANNAVIEENAIGIIHKGKTILKKTKWLFLTTTFSAALFCVVLQKTGTKEMQTIQAHEEQQEPSIRSDLFIPAQSVLLFRPEEIKQIDEKFKGEEGIRALALIGPGGIGKTTLTRQYAHQQKSQVVWEINAEAPESLSSSFEDLAHALAITEKDQKALSAIQGTQDLSKREKQLIDFVKQRLKSYSEWLLIYDNVNDFQDIHKYFPKDPATWGKGKIILTTRNNNIQNSKHINNSLKMEELTPDQKLTLFVKIMTNGNVDAFTTAQKEQAKAFLEKLPPYPLDISVAAYYLKMTNISYDEYLEHASKTNQDFSNVQEKVLQEVGDYTKTRYNIITLSLQHLMNAHKDFSSLLVFISLLDSQNIPRNLLKTYKDNLSIDDFILNLKKYSLITSHSPSPSPQDSTFSLHRSTQEISLRYLIKTLNLEKNNPLFQDIAEGLENYIDGATESEDLAKLRLLVSHCEAFLSHNGLLNNHIQHLINAELGSIYYFIGNYEKGKHLLETSVAALDEPQYHERLTKFLIYLGKIYVETDRKSDMKKLIETIHKIYESQFSLQTPKSAQILTLLGDMYDSLGYFQEAKDALQKSVLINKKHPNNKRELAWTLGLLGNVSRKMGHYRDAKGFFEESLTIYRSLVSKDHFKIGWILVHLGNVCAGLGEAEKARQLSEEGVALYKKSFPEDHPDLAWATSYLGNVYTAVGEYEKAQELLQKTLTILNRNFEESHGTVMRTKAYLANAYMESGRFKEAKNILEQIVKKYEQMKDADLIEFAMARQLLAEVYSFENQIDVAENFMKKALEIFSHHNHPHASRSLEGLADLYLKRSTQVMDVQNVETAKTKAACLLNQALEVATQHFPADSHLIRRIELKLKGP